MIFDKEGNTTIVLQEHSDLATFLSNFNGAYEQLKNDHIIVNLFFVRYLVGQ